MLTKFTVPKNAPATYTLLAASVATELTSSLMPALLSLWNCFAH